MIIFLLASTYIQNSILDYLSLILGFNIESVLILKENYYDFRINKFELYELTVVDTIKDGIARSDITITIPYEIPQTTIDEADGMCKQFRKKFTLLPIEKIYNNVPHQFLTVNAHYSNIYISKNPIILILQLGNFAQITKFQLSINKFFSDKGYNFGQIFSSEFLSAVTDEDSMENVILNKIESLRLSELETDFSIITWPFDIFTSIELLEKYLHYLCPNYCIMCVENHFDKHSDFKNFFALKFNITIDAFVKSDYLTFTKNGRNYYLYIGSLSNNQRNNTDIDIICTDSIVKLTYPQGIVPII